MSDVLVFVKNPDGTLTAQTALATPDGQSVSPATVNGVPVLTPVPTVATSALALTRTLPGGAVVAELFDPGSPGGLVRGVLKLAERFLVHLLTPAGTPLYRSGQGCLFLGQLRQKRLIDERDVLAAFTASLLAIAPNLQAEEASTDPSDERFGSARVSQLTVAPGVLTLGLTVTSLAGGQAGLALPLAFPF